MLPEILSRDDLHAEQRSLRSLQSHFVKLLGLLIGYAYSVGYELTLGEGFVETPRKTRDGAMVADGVHMPSSLHYSGLALDLNLFVGGEYVQDGQNEAWSYLGQFWESLDPDCCWGGRFGTGDSNHFSLGYGGRK